MHNNLFTFNTDRFKNLLWLYFLAIVVINIIFRIIYLNFSSLWYDEIISIQSASLDFGHIKHVSEWDNNPPFYYYCLSLWIKLFDDSEFTVRLLSVLFISFGGGVLFLFCNRFFNKTTAIIASFLYLSSNMLFFYSHETRAYSLSVLLALISSYVFFNVNEKPTYKNALLLGLFNFLIIYTHYITGLVLIFESIFMLVYFEKSSKIKFSLSLLVTVLLILFRFTKKQFLLIIGFNNAEHKFWLGKSTFKYLAEALSDILFSEVMIIPLLLVILAGIVIIIYFRNRTINFSYLYCFSIGIGSIVIVYLLGKLTPIFLDRYLLFTIPFIIVLVSFSLSYIKYSSVPIALSIIFFIGSAFTIDYKTEKGMDYRNAVSFVKSIKGEKDLVIVKTIDIRPMFGYYYDKKFLSEKKDQLPLKENVVFCSTWAEVDRNVQDYARIIIVDSYQEFNPHEEDFVKKLSAIKRFHANTNYYKGVNITVYQ